MSTKFCTVEQAKVYLRSQDDYTGDDALIEAQIVAATSLIQQYTRRSWVHSTHVDYFGTADLDVAIRQGNNFVAFGLREKNVQTTPYPEVKFSTSGDWTNAVALQTTTYDVDTRLGRIVMYPGKMRSYGRSLRVSYTAGYEMDVTDTDLCLVPTNLMTATAVQAAFSVNRILNATGGSSKSSKKGSDTTFKVSPIGLVQEALSMVRQDVRTFVGGNS